MRILGRASHNFLLQNSDRFWPIREYIERCADPRAKFIGYLRLRGSNLLFMKSFIIRNATLVTTNT